MLDIKLCAIFFVFSFAAVDFIYSAMHMFACVCKTKAHCNTFPWIDTANKQMQWKTKRNEAMELRATLPNGIVQLFHNRYMGSIVLPKQARISFFMEHFHPISLNYNHQRNNQNSIHCNCTPRTSTGTCVAQPKHIYKLKHEQKMRRRKKNKISNQTTHFKQINVSAGKCMLHVIRRKIKYVRFECYTLRNVVVCALPHSQCTFKMLKSELIK